MPPMVTETERARATARYVRVAPNKARQVAAHLRGLGVEEARRVLAFSPKDVAVQMLKTLNSAVANAEHNLDPPLDADELVVTSVVIDEGPMMKRFQPRAMGRAYRVRKRTSHIMVAVGTPAETAPRRPRRPAVRAGAARTGTPRVGGSTSSAAVQAMAPAMGASGTRATDTGGDVADTEQE